MTELVCIVCPKGCRLKVDANDGYKAAGHDCARGEAYGRGELENPVRTITSTVKITGALYRRCPVKTNSAIPKRLIFDAMRLLESVELKAPVKEGDVVVGDICGTGVSFVTTRDL